MNFKGLSTLNLSAALLAGVLFVSTATAATPQARRLARQVSLEASTVFRTADRQARRFDHREDRALMNLRDVQDSARDLEMDIQSSRPMRTQQSLQRLEEATQRASRTLINLSAYRLIDRQFRNIEMNVSQIRRELRNGGGQGQVPRVAPLAREYKQQITSVIQDLRSRIRPGQQRPRLRNAIQSLRSLKLEADMFLQTARNAQRPRRVKRAFEQLTATHRMTRQSTVNILQRTGSMHLMRQASQTLRQIGQRLDRVGGGFGGGGHNGGGFGGGFNDDFGSFPRH
ncbi:MAG: hypothetical protein ACJAT2_001116 [Bacteriovoracaceae bacterium]|jgi:hypothetical protein